MKILQISLLQSNLYFHFNFFFSFLFENSNLGDINNKLKTVNFSLSLNWNLKTK